MEEGLFTLLFILFMVAVSIMDAVGRRRKKQRRMEQMEEEEGDGAREDSPYTRASDRETYEAYGRTEEEAERETADTMVPDDFWAILTGEAPEGSPPPAEGPSPGSQELPHAGRAEARHQVDQDAYRDREAGMDPFHTDGLGRRGDPDPPKDPHIPMPVPGDRMSRPGDPVRGAEDEEEAPTRRSARWMEGTRGRGASDTWAAASIEAEEARVYETPQEPWGDLEDIAAGDLTGPGEGKVQEIGGALRTAPRRGTGRGTYTRLLETGDVKDLRKAVVLREVLDRPVAFRDGVGPEW